jgi:exodeoxyribonuclease VII small subunit
MADDGTTDHDPDPDDTAAEPAIGYGEALEELEAILDEIEDDSVDVDVLAARVQRAAVLLRVCRSRIAAARVEVETIVAELDTQQDDRPA